MRGHLNVKFSKYVSSSKNLGPAILRNFKIFIHKHKADVSDVFIN